MVEIDLSNSLVNCYGPGTSGKSNFIKYLLSKQRYSRHAVFDPMKEYDPDKYVVYRPDAVTYEGGNEEFNRFVKSCIESPREKRPRYIVADEAANFLPGGNRTIGTYASQLAFHNTHIYPGITLITANRHPADLDGSIRDMYDHMFIFGASGDRARRALNGLKSGLFDRVQDLQEYHFLHVTPMGEITTMAPVDDMGEYERV